MDFCRGIDPFIRWFYFCGMSCYPSFDAFLTDKIAKKRFVRFVPTVGLLALIICLGALIYCRIPHFPKGPSLGYFLYIHMLIPILTLFICVIPMVFASTYFEQLSSQISTCERLSRAEFSLDPREFRCHFMRRVCIILITLILPALVALFRGDFDKKAVATATLIMKSLIICALIQSVFYIDLLDYLLQCFVRHLKSRSTTQEFSASVQATSVPDLDALQMKAKISQYKILHFELWKFSMTINRLFGWTNVAILLHNFFFAIRNVHSLYYHFECFPCCIFAFRTFFCTK